MKDYSVCGFNLFGITGNTLILKCLRRPRRRHSFNLTTFCFLVSNAFRKRAYDCIRSVRFDLEMKVKPNNLRKCPQAEYYIGVRTSIPTP